MKIKQTVFKFPQKINVYGQSHDCINGITIDYKNRHFRLPFVEDINNGLELKIKNYLIKNADCDSINNKRLLFYLDSIKLTFKGINYNFDDIIFDLKDTKSSFRKIKLNGKIEQLSEVRNILKKNNNIKIRLDGNQQLNQTFITPLNELYIDFKKNIEFIEEPFSSIDNNHLLSIPIAYDESLDFQNIQDFQKIIILKPVLIGSIEQILAVIKKNSHRKIILSSFYEPPELYSGYKKLIDELNCQSINKETIHGLSTYKYW